MAAPRPRDLRGLQWRAAFSTAAALCVVVALFALVFLRLQDGRQHREAAAHAAALGESLLRGIGQAMHGGERAVVRRALAELAATPGPLEVVIADASGTVRFASARALVGRPLRDLAYGTLDERQPWRVAADGAGRVEALYRGFSIAREERCRACHDAGQEHLGTLGVAVSLAAAREARTLARNLLLGLAALVSLALLLLNRLFYSRCVLRPLERLGERFEAVANGKPACQAPPARPVRDEIDHLHQAFDRMIAEVRRVHALEVAAERERAAAQRDEHYRSEIGEVNSQLDRRIAALDEANDRVNQLALQLDDRNLLLEKAVKNVSALNRVGVALSSELDLDRLVQLLINISVKGLRVEIGTILLFDERREHLVVRASSGLPAGVDQELSVAPGESISATVAGNGQPLLIRHVDGSQGVRPLSRFGFTRRSVLCVPIKMKDKVLGAIELTNRRGGECFSIDDLEMLQSVANQAAVAIENAHLYRDVQRSYLETVLALVQVVEEKDRYTRGHSERVTAFSVKIANALGLPPQQIRMIEYAGVLHDIGKIGIDQAIIQKNGRLTPEEMTVIRNHPLIGERIIRPIGFLAGALPAIAQHHEHYDGRGYPHGLTGEFMAFEARILAVADAYDAMISERPYRKPLSKRAAIAELVRCSGSQFDPLVVEHFIDLLHNDPDMHQLEVEAAAVGT